MNWYKLKKIARRGFPLIDEWGYDPYKKSNPGDQDGNEGISYQSRPGATGLGSNYTKTKGPKGVDLGVSQDIDDSEMPDLPSDHDGEDSEKTNDGKIPNNTEHGNGFGEKGWSPWYDDSFPENSDKYDEHPDMLSRMDGVQSQFQRNVYDELVSKRIKK